MKIPTTQIPASFSKTNVFPYISKLLACEHFATDAHLKIFIVEKEKITQRCIEKIRLLQHQHPQDANYLWEYLYAFQYHPSFRNEKLEEIIDVYKNTLHTLMSQHIS